MRSRSACFCLLFVLLLSSFAHSRTGLGVTAGVNIANLDTNPKGQTDSRSGFALGAVVDIPLAKNVAVRMTPLYLPKGAKTSETDPDLGRIDATFKLDYLELPLFLRYEFQGTSVSPYLLAGPALGINLSAKLEVDLMGISSEVDVEKQFESIDFGFGFGGGLSFPVGTASLFVEGSYLLGFSNIIDTGTSELLGEEIVVSGDAKNRGIKLMAGMTFPLGNKK